MADEIVIENKEQIIPPIGQIEALDGLLSQEELQSIAAENQKLNPKPTDTTVAETNAVETKKETEVTTPIVTPVKTETTTLTDENKELLKNTTFLSNTVTDTDNPIEIKEWVDGATYLSKETGIEVKELSDISKVVKEFKTYKEQVEGLPDLKSKVTNFENIWAKMPDDLHKAMNAWLKQEDYRSILKKELSETIDITVPFEKQDEKTLLDFFHPGKFSIEDYEDEENKAVKFALDNIKEKEFPNYVKSIGDARTNYRKNLDLQKQDHEDKLKTSATESFTTLTKNMNLAEPNKQAIAKVMDGGDRVLYSIFFTDDGKWKADAAEKINYLLHAKSDLEIAKKVITNQAMSKANEEIVTRGADNPTIKKQTETSTITAEQAADKIVENILI